MSEWSEILLRINDIYNNCSRYRKVWFRGHNNSNYKLYSSLYRISTKDLDIRSLERNMYYLFINIGDYYLNFDKNKSWNVLFCMQHYGMKTRLMDWTTNLLTAIYFANLNRKEGTDACIWILDPYKLNKIANQKFKDKIFDDKLYSIDNLPDQCKDYINYFNQRDIIPSIALLPRRSNSRLLAQSGAFIIQGNRNIALDREYPELKDDGLIKINLPWSTYEDSKRYLDINGINYFSLFPEISGLSKYITDEVLKLEDKNNEGE
jgi:hypothetical protein